jgi:sigma-B regulation protein RsbU (phosphoserine phosphatase)
MQQTIQLSAGDQLLIVSDGILEACGRNGEEFGESRLLESFRNPRAFSASGACADIINKVKRFSEGCPQADDLTVVAAKVLTKPEIQVRNRTWRELE